MLIDIQKRKYMRCGTEFTYLLGGIILRPPVCSRCALEFSRKIGKFLG